MRRFLPYIYWCWIAFFTGQSAQAQYGINDTLLRAAVIYESDTLEARSLPEIWLYSQVSKAYAKKKEAWTRLRNAVYVTYPYAKRAGWVMNDIHRRLDGITDKKQRKTYIRSREKELRKEFTEPLTNLSVYQGKILMKLIYRETGDNCYEIIKEYKSGVTARMYQTVAFFFGSSLKQEYDAVGEDADIEKIVREVERMYGYQ